LPTFQLQPIAFSAKLIDLIEHLIHQVLGRGAGYSAPLQLPDLSMETFNLTPHVLDVAPYVPNVRHRSPPQNQLAYENKIRTKCKPLGLAVKR
jgi:hypothetical protein